MDTMRAFGEVISACFGKVADDNYKEVINKFENCWYDLKLEFEINFTNKAHIVISHVPQVIERTGRGLFNQSEEVVEAPHAKFDIFWRRYKVLDVESESHGDALLNCLNDFNTKNI